MAKSKRRWAEGDWVTPAEARWGLILVLPVMALFLALKIAPLLYGGYLSLTQYNLLQPPRYIGFDSYLRLWHDPRAWNAFKITLYYTVGTVVPATILSLAIAVMLDTKLRGMGTFRTVFYLPQVASWVTIGVAWLYIMNPAFGPMNYLLSLAGVERQGFLTSSGQALPTLIGIGIWRQMGYSVVIFLAGLQGVPQYLRKAALMDGASWWRSFSQVTLPILMPTTMFVVVTAVIFNLQIFDQVVVLTGGGPGRATTTAVLFSYNQAFQSFAMGYAAAVAVVLFVAIMVLSLLLLGLSGQLASKRR